VSGREPVGVHDGRSAATDVKAAPAAGVPQMKLLVDTRSRRVLYAEARKDALDFLIFLLRVCESVPAAAGTDERDADSR